MSEIQVDIHSRMGKTHHIDAIIQNSTPIKMGTRPKERLKLALKNRTGPESRTISMVKRKVEYSELWRGDRTPAEHFFHIWDSMRVVGLPVVPSVGIVSEDEVIMTDVIADGSVIYGKDYADKDRSPQPTDPFFKNQSLEEIERKANEYARLADKNKIELSPDHAFDLIIHPNGGWELMTRDIKNSTIGVEYMTEKNEEKVKRFMRHLSFIKNSLA